MSEYSEARYETYHARADAARAKVVSATGSPTRIVTLPPTVFTHQVVVEERVGPPVGPTGVLAVGTQVLLMGVHGDRCWVVDGADRHVEVARSSLRPLTDQPEERRR